MKKLTREKFICFFGKKVCSPKLSGGLKGSTRDVNSTYKVMASLETREMTFGGGLEVVPSKYKCNDECW